MVPSSPFYLSKTAANLKQNKQGYWTTNEKFHFELKQPILDVKEFGNLFEKYLKMKGLPFKFKEAHLQFTDLRADEALRPYYHQGSYVIFIKDKTIKARLNPFHNELCGEETIVINWYYRENEFYSYQECKWAECGGHRITWKLPLGQIRAFKDLLTRFTDVDDVYKLLLECSGQDEKMKDME